jgi:hypothetical protein
MQARRRKVVAGKPADAGSCNLEDTRGEETDVAEPEAPSDVGKAPPKAKDRHPMPWGLVISDVFHLDVHKTFTRLTDELSLGDGATEYGTVIRALDASSRNLFEAARLARRAKLEDEKFSSELDKEREVLRTAAQRALELERSSGQRSKAPTIQDIEDRMLSTWPDQVTAIRLRKEEMHGAYRAIEALELAWRERCQALRTLAQQFKAAGA